MKIIDENIENIKPFERLTDREKKELFCNKCYEEHFIKKDGIIYHRRNNIPEFLLNELIGELISEYFDIKTVKSILYKSNDSFKYTLLTKLFTNNNENYSYIDKLFPNYQKREDIFNLNNLNKIYLNNKIINMNIDSHIKLLRELKKMIVLDYIIDNRDRVNINFIFNQDKDKVELKELFDFESAFTKITNKNYNVFKFNLNKKHDVKYLKNDEEFNELFELALNLDINKIFKRLKDEYPIILNSKDKLLYESVIKKKQNEIKTYKLVK